MKTIRKISFSLSLRRLAGGVLCLWLVVVGSGHALRGQTDSRKLNIISIVTDDQASWAVGAYGNSEVRTPHLDRLATEGALFTNAFVTTPVCSPSRASFLTGLYSTQVGITDWIAPVGSDVGVGLPDRAVTWPEVLKQHGYTTALLGKWHLGLEPDFHPTRHGFDFFFGFLGGSNRPMDPILEVDGKERQLSGSLPDLLTDQAIQFIEKNQSRPFAVLIHFRAPHRPYGPVPEEDSAPFVSLDPTIPEVKGIVPGQVKELRREYYASVHSVDRNVGRLLDRLDQLQLAGRTVILFMSDNGYMIGEHALHTKGNAYWLYGGVEHPIRPNMYEESIRVPLLVRWPGAASKGTRIAELVTNQDIFASVLSMLGISSSETGRQQRMDFSPLLRGQKTQWRREVFGQYDLHNNGLAFMRMIRTDHWKLIRHYFTNYLDELYDLESDPGETRNLYRVPEHQKTIEQLQDGLSDWQKSIDDPVLKWDPRARSQF